MDKDMRLFRKRENQDEKLIRKMKEYDEKKKTKQSESKIYGQKPVKGKTNKEKSISVRN